MSQQLLQALRSFSKLEKAVSAGKGYQVRSLSTLVTISRLWLICWGWFYSMLVHGQYWDNSAGKECFLLSRTVTWSGRPSLDSDGPDNQVKAVCRTCIGKFCVRIYIRTQKWTFTSESTMAFSLVWGEALTVRVLLVKESFSLCRIGLSLGTSKYDLEVIFIEIRK